MNNTTIETALKNAFANIDGICNEIPVAIFYTSTNNKWSIAMQIQHLIISANNTKLAFSLPKILVGIIGGKSNRPSKTIDALKEKYYGKLADGATATKKFTPTTIPSSISQQEIFTRFKKSSDGLLKAIEKNSEADLDKYIIPHPLLGKITLRELCYFTIFHTNHHFESIQNIAKAK
jgi:hypothetical protein